MNHITQKSIRIKLYFHFHLHNPFCAKSQENLLLWDHFVAPLLLTCTVSALQFGYLISAWVILQWKYKYTHCNEDLFSATLNTVVFSCHQGSHFEHDFRSTVWRRHMFINHLLPIKQNNYSCTFMKQCVCNMKLVQ